ncbi:MAG: DinB family protein [Propionibacteriales bacterium]|nr:DinB family protein [Propionibacteriales bacterium]
MTDAAIPSSPSPQGRTRPDWSGDERSQLAQLLDYNRATVRLKTGGLSDADARRRLTPSPLTSIAGLVAHLVWVERYWIEDVLGGGRVEYPWTDEHPDGDWEQGDTRPLSELLAQYDAACATNREVVAGLDLEHIPRPDSPQPISVRATLLHMIEETARHVGHIDILRELTDGVTGE